MIVLSPKNDPVLTTETERFDLEKPPTDPIALAHDMVSFIHKNNGLGLSANQFGLPYKVLAMRSHPENFVCFNPRIVDQSEEELIMEETSFSFPGLVVKIKRPRTIKVRFNTPNGETLTHKFTGMSARVFQHQMDHLNGVIFYTRASKIVRNQALKKWKKTQNKA